MLEVLLKIQQRTPVERPEMGDLQIQRDELRLVSLPPEGYLLDRFQFNWSLGKQQVPAELLIPLESFASEDSFPRFHENARELGINTFSICGGSIVDDFDGDGFLDIVTSDWGSSGQIRFHHNDGDGSFTDRTESAGLTGIFGGLNLVQADYDNDGDQDIYIELDGALQGDAFGNVFFSNPGFDNHWLCLRLVGRRSNRSAIGVRLRLDINEAGSPRTVYRWVNSGGSFGANPLRQQIGVGKATRIERLEAYWPTSNTTQQFENLEVDQYIEDEEDPDHFTKLAWRTLTFWHEAPCPGLRAGKTPS